MIANEDLLKIVAAYNEGVLSIEYSGFPVVERLSFMHSGDPLLTIEISHFWAFLVYTQQIKSYEVLRFGEMTEEGISECLQECRSIHLSLNVLLSIVSKGTPLADSWEILKPSLKGIDYVNRIVRMIDVYSEDKESAGEWWNAVTSPDNRLPMLLSLRAYLKRRKISSGSSEFNFALEGGYLLIVLRILGWVYEVRVDGKVL